MAVLYGHEGAKQLKAAVSGPGGQVVAMGYGIGGSRYCGEHSPWRSEGAISCVHFLHFLVFLRDSPRS
jgi:hypothetical protein